MSEPDLTTTEAATATTQETTTAATEATATETAATEATETAVTPEPAPEYEIAYPEGLPVNKDLEAAFKETAKAARLTQEQAQQFADMGRQVAEKITADQLAAQAAIWKVWESETLADKEFGGAGFDENLAIAQKALDAFATPELKELLNVTGVGDHPEMVRLFYRAGKAISEDKLIPGNKAPAGQTSLADKLYKTS